MRFCGMASVHVCLPLLSLVQQKPHAIICTCQGRQSTGQAFYHRVTALSHCLTSKLGIQAGDVVLMVAWNSDRLLELLLATMDAGAIATPINYRWSPVELNTAIKLTKPKLIIVEDNCCQLTLDALASSISQQSQLIYLGEPDHAALTNSAFKAKLPHAATEALISSVQRPLSLQLKAHSSGAALMCFTSGTTGQPKGVILSHAAFHVQSLAKLAVVGYSSSDVYLHTSPLCHVGGLSSAMAVLMAGGSHVILPKFTAAAALDCMAHAAVTSFIAVPAMVQDMMAHARANSGPGGVQHLGCVKRILVGAGGTTPQMQGALAALFPQAALFSAYGMTEASSSMTFQTLHTPAGLNPGHAFGVSTGRFPASAAASSAAPATSSSSSSLPLSLSSSLLSLPPPSTSTSTSGVASLSQPWPHRIATVDQSSRAVPSSSNSSSSHVHSAAEGQFQGSCVGWPSPGVQVHVHIAEGEAGPVGEVWTRGPHVMLGYWDNPQETAQVITPDGWLRTGDLGYFDSVGRLWLLGRAKDMVKSGGENVYAAEVEALLMRHPAVAAAAVVGAPSERLGEQVAAVLVLQSSWSWQGMLLPHAQQPGANHRNAGGIGEGDDSSSSNSSSSSSSSGQVLSLQGLQGFCRQQGLTGYKLPRLVFAYQGPLPTNSNGKVLKHVLKQQVAVAVYAMQSHSKL